MMNLQANDVNKLRRMLASGEISEDDLRGMALSGSFGPPPVQQNALAQSLSPQEQFAMGDTSGPLPMGSMRNESTGKMIYFQPDPNAPRTNADPGFSYKPYAAAPKQARARMKVVGVGNRGITDLGEEDMRALPVDYTRPGIEIPGLGKGRYTADGRSAVIDNPDGSKTKVLLGYDAEASDRRNDRALKTEMARANLEQTREQTGALRDKRAMMAEAANAPPAPPVVKPTAGQTAVDKEFAKEYVSFKATGGYADVVKQLGQLKAVSTELEKDDSLTGPFVGMMSDKYRAVTNPKAVDVKNAVEEVVQRNLRLVLGAQFTEREGERLIARAYNPQLDAKVNKRRVDRLIQQIEAAARVKQDASDYFEANGTLVGWNGRLPSWGDFNPEFGEGSGGGGQAPSNIPQAAIDYLKSNPGMRAAFDKKYGQGASAGVLGQ